MAALAPPKQGQRRTKLSVNATKQASAPFNKWTLVSRDQTLKNRTNGGMRNNNNNKHMSALYSSNNNLGGNRKDIHHLDANSYNNNNNGNFNGGNDNYHHHPQTRLNFGKSDDKAHSDAFPERYTMCGMLDVRTNKKRSWKRRYFVLSNNFLLCGATAFVKKLESKVKNLLGTVFDNSLNRPGFNQIRRWMKAN